MCGAVGLRGRRMRRQGTRCEGYCEVMLSAPLTALCPRRVTAIHMRSRRRGMRVECAYRGLIARTIFSGYSSGLIFAFWYRRGLQGPDRTRAAPCLR